MATPDHVKQFIQDIFPKKPQRKTSSRNPYRDAYEESLVSRNEIVKSERELRRDEGRKLRGGL